MPPRPMPLPQSAASLPAFDTVASLERVACKCPSSLHVDTIVAVHIASMTCDYTLVQTGRGGRLPSKFCTPNGGVCTSKPVKQSASWYAGTSSPGSSIFIAKEAFTRWAGGVDLSMMPEAGILDQADETCREYERVVDPKYLDQIRTQANKFSNKGLSRQSGVARSAIMNFKKGRNTFKPRTLRKLLKAI